MKKEQIFVVFAATLALYLFFTPSILQAKKTDNPYFQYVVFPTPIYTESEISLTICLVNLGGEGELIYDGSDTDQIVISVPLGSGPGDLVDDTSNSLFYCTSQSPLWVCEEPDIFGDKIFFTFHPEGIIQVREGETICFDINPINVNLEPGLVFLDVDQQIDKRRAQSDKNNTISILKIGHETTTFTETDPLFLEMNTEMELEDQIEDVSDIFTNNDGNLADDDLSDNQIADLSDVDTTGMTNDKILKYLNGGWKIADDNTGIMTETDPTVNAEVNDGVDWSELSGIPLDIIDGDDKGIIEETDPTVLSSVKDGVSWDEIMGIPLSFADGIDNVGITAEMDPKVGSTITNRISKWNGAQLIDSKSIFENSSGNVGIGMMNPASALDVNGTVTAIAFVGDGSGLTNLSSGLWSEIEGNVVRNSGNVGIGTQSPVARVTIAYTGTIGNPLDPDFSRAGLVLDDGKYKLALDENQILSTHNLNFATQNGTSLHIASNGNVGIGTTHPVGKLDVNGPIYQRGDEFNADYVFGTEYELESIGEHADFMWDNKHLKAIPVAQQVDDDSGRQIIETGAHRRGIVEELQKAHIYIEQLHKLIEQQNIIIENLEVRIDALENNEY